jgi:hypothetical protein
MQFFISILLAGTKMVCSLLSGKIILNFFGVSDFVAYLQYTQIISVLMPASAGFLSAAFNRAAAEQNKALLLRLNRIAGLIFFAVIAIEIVLLFDLGWVELAKRFLGAGGWALAVVFLVPITVLSRYIAINLAVFIGQGKGLACSWAEFGITVIQTIVIAFAGYNRSGVQLMSAPFVATLIGVLIVCGLRLTSQNLNHSLGNVLLEGSGVRVFPYVIIGFTVSALGPIVMVMLRAHINDSVGVDQLASFIASQRLVSAVTAPISLYAQVFLTAKFLKLCEGESKLLINKLQTKMLTLLMLVYCALVVILPYIFPVVFSEKVGCDRILFSIIAFGEGFRSTASIRVQKLVALGRWRSFIFGEICYVTIVAVAVFMFPSSAIVCASAYALAAVIYLAVSSWFDYNNNSRSQLFCQ